MNLIIDIFHSFSIFFIIVEIFQLIKRDEIYRKSKKENLNLNDTSFYFIFYIFKLLYLPWMVVGLFSSLSPLYLGLISLGLFKYLVLLTKKDFIINLYDLLNALVSCILLSFICYQALSL